MEHLPWLHAQLTDPSDVKLANAGTLACEILENVFSAQILEVIHATNEELEPCD